MSLRTFLNQWGNPMQGRKSHLQFENTFSSTYYLDFVIHFGIYVVLGVVIWYTIFRWIEDSVLDLCRMCY